MCVAVFVCVVVVDVCDACACVCVYVRKKWVDWDIRLGMTSMCA